MPDYDNAEIRQYIREVVSEAKRTANVETGYLKRSINGALIGRDRSVEFRQIFYGAYNNNSKLVEIAERIMPNDLKWKVIFEDEDGNETTISAKTRTGRKISTRAVTSGNSSTLKIKALISVLKYGKTKIDKRKRDRADDEE